MTALTQYARLETFGLWRPGPGEAGRQVVVSFGDATLVLSDGAGSPLTHWSLPAVVRLNPDATPALSAPDEDGSETLELDDDLMVSAIETVRRTVRREQGRTWRLRKGAGWAVAALLVVVVVLWGPSALRQEALAVIPPAKRTEIGATLLGHLQRTLGPACRDALGADALQRLHARTLGPEGQAVVLPLGPAAPLALPGGITVLSREMVERAAEPAVVAGHLLAAGAAPGDQDPLARLLDAAGVWATLGLLTSGNLDPAVLEAQAGSLLSAPFPTPDPARLGPAFAQAEVPLAPYARDLDPSGESVADLLAADAYAGGEAPLLITDSEWVALQEICRGQ
jgi:hypothetical protein